MAMLPNGNYENIISPVQHQCKSDDGIWTCVEYGWGIGRLRFQIESGDPYEDGFGSEIDVKYCPFCGYHGQTEKSI